MPGQGRGDGGGAGNNSNMPTSSHPSDQNACDCGFDPTNRRHFQSYWEGLADPRDLDGMYFG